ncbi:MAG: dinitrogenase iron-molybdenum cofactor biosynthesis protein [Erysipelotrichia bacterium]|jgi:predicted Fe-Mo cluster-binding NifX family protein|nr:dinitrogenase iron-molybdenum cofactor biosynthesis protein [Erysipelotrichia bacterium]
MKIAIPVENKSLDSNVCLSFGRAPYFLFYNVETKESNFVVNSAAAVTGGAGIKAAQTIVDNKANVLLVTQLGENAASVLKAADIKIYQAKNASVKENLDDFTDDKLSLLEKIHAGFHGRRNR